MSESHSHDFEAHFAETGWVRRLARRLAGDPHLGDDLAQEAWFAALERPPGGDRPLGPWLAGVLRHLAGKERRGAARRARREHEHARSGVAPSTEALVERAAVHRDLVAAVMALHEPYRTAVLLRYLEELPPRVIAARLGVPVCTVHTRLARGLAQLRRRLDRRHGDSWVTLVLAPLTRPSSPTIASTTGLLAMNAKWISTAATVLLVVAAGAFGAVEWLRPPAEERVANISPPLRMQNGEATPALPAGEPLLRTEVAAEAPAPSLLDAADRDRDLHGIVVTPEGTAIFDATVRVLFPIARHVPTLGGWRDAERLEATMRTNPRGEFLVPLDPLRTYDLTVESPGRARVRIPGLYAGEFVRVELPAEALLVGTVTSRDTGDPVPGVEIELALGIIKSAGALRATATTDPEGRYRIGGLPPGSYTLSAESAGHVPAYAQVRLEPGLEARHDVALERGASIRGRVTDGETDLPLEGARVQVGWRGKRDVSVTDEDGRYAVHGISVDPGNSVRLHVSAPGYGQWQSTLYFVPEEGLEQDYFLLPARTARGRLLDGRGEPVAGAYIAAVSYDRTSADRQYDYRFARSEADGRFVVRDLRPDLRHSLLVRAEGLATAFLDFPARETERRAIDLGDVTLEAPAALAGRLVDPAGDPLGGYVIELAVDVAHRGRLEAAGPGARGYPTDGAFGTGRISARTDARGRFRFDDLPAGFFRLRGSRKGCATSAALDVELDAGESQDDLELVLDPGLSIAGVVLDPDGRPLAGAPVTARTGATDAPLPVDVYNLSRGDGSFFLEGLPPGTYDLSSQGRLLPGLEEPLPAPTEWKDIAAGTSDLVLAMRRGSFIEGRILDEDGDPVPGSHVYAQGARANYPVLSADRQGRFRLLVPAHDVYRIIAMPPTSSRFGLFYAPSAEWMDANAVTVANVRSGARNLVITLPAPR